jgi:hypothetical protein
MILGGRVPFGGSDFRIPLRRLWCTKHCRYLPAENWCLISTEIWFYESMHQLALISRQWKGFTHREKFSIGNHLHYVFASYQQHISDTSLTLFCLWREFIMFLRTLLAEEEPDKSPLFVLFVGRSLPLAIVLIFKSPWNLKLNVIWCLGRRTGVGRVAWLR